MQEVLQHPRYDYLTERRTDIGEQIGDLIERFLTWIFEGINFSMPAGSGGGVGMIVVIFSVVAVILAVMAIVVFILSRRNKAATRHTLEDIFEEIRNHTVAELLELGEKAETRRIAVRYKYIAIILSLNENDIITIAPSHTNAVILRQIRDTAPALADSFSQIAEVFHLAWFGHKELPDNAFAAFNSAVADSVKRSNEKGKKVVRPQ